MTTKDVTKHSDGNATLVVDGRYFPLTIYTWNGVSMPLVDAYFKARWAFDAQARQQKSKIILVSDLSAFGTPPATIRKALAEQAAEIDKSEAMHCYVSCVPSALIRGVVTAMTWIVGEKGRPNTNFASMALALRHALTEYERLGVTPPKLDPNAYEIPKD